MLELGFELAKPLPPLALLVIIGIIVKDFLLIGDQVVTVPAKIILARPKAIGVIAIGHAILVFFAGLFFSKYDCLLKSCYQ